MRRRGGRNTKARRWTALIFVLFLFVVFFCSTQFPGNPIMIYIMFPTLLGLIIFCYVFFRSPFYKGKVGESKVKRRLEYLADKYDGYLINDLIIPGENGKTSQIDHILLTTRGVFVIETKNYSGMIYGNDKEQHWTQVLAYGNKKNQFYNPVLQNATHIYRLDSLLERKVPLISKIVFIDADLSNVSSKFICYLEDSKDIIDDNDPVILDQKDIDDCYEILMNYKTNPIATSKEHVKNIRQNERAIENGICPRCGGKIILKYNKKGQPFRACENYPRCKFVKK